MSDRKLGKRHHLTVVWLDRSQNRVTPGHDGVPIYTEILKFRMRRMHRKGSNRPEGYYHDTYDSDATVSVRWLLSEGKYFAPELTFRPSELGIKTVQKVTKAFKKIPSHKLTPEALCEELEAMIVESVPDEHGAYRDYRPVRLVGEPAMVTIARAAL